MKHGVRGSREAYRCSRPTIKTVGSVGGFGEESGNGEGLKQWLAESLACLRGSSDLNDMYHVAVRMYVSYLAWSISSLPLK